MKTLVFLTLLGSLTLGCAGTLEESRPAIAIRLSSAARCQALSDKQATWGGVAAGSAFLAGVSGLGTIKTEGTGDTVLAITAVSAGAIGAASTYFSQSTASTYMKECTK